MAHPERVAIAVLDGRVSPVFDVSRHLLVCDVQDGVVLDRQEVSLDLDDPYLRATELSRMDVRTLICGAISRRLARLLATCDVTLVPFVAGEVPVVLDAFVAGELPNPALAMPGCGLRRRRRMRRRGRGR